MCRRARLHHICTSRKKVQTFLIIVANHVQFFIAEIEELFELLVIGIAGTVMV